MALIRSFLFVALVIFLGGCATKKTVSVEVPKEPIETKILVPSFEEEEVRRREALSREAEQQEKEDSLEEEIKKTKETRAQRKERLEKLKETELENLVFKESLEEQSIRARAEEIDREKARKSAQKAKERGDSPSMRQARRELAKSKRLDEERKKEMEESLKEANIAGCDPATVEILPRGDKFNPFNALPPTLRVRVSNNGTLPINLETPFRNYGIVVKNLCAGGSVTVTFQLRWEDPVMMQIPIVARTFLLNGKSVDEQRVYFLNKMNSQFMRVDNQVWSVDFSRYVR